MSRASFWFAIVVTCVLVLGPLSAQGPASCGFHLDIRANGTTSHSAVADMPNAPGGGGSPFPSTAAGNPYDAYATAGSIITMVINGNPLNYGPAPLGAGSCVSIIWTYGPPTLASIPLGAPFLPTCDGSAHVIGVLPSPLAIIDTCGFLSPPAPFGLFDLGGGRLTWTSSYPPFAPPVTFQAVGRTPAGAIWVTNAVNLIPGSNPNEASVPAPVACQPGTYPALDEGQSLANPVPPGFTFYGYPVASVDLDTNGFVDFVPGTGPAVAGGCDFGGNYGDLGCVGAPAGVQARPQIAIAHSDFDFTKVLAAPFVPSMTYELRPAGPTWPEAAIYRWNNAPIWGIPAGSAGMVTLSFTLELQGSVCPGCVPALMPWEHRIVTVRSWTTTASGGSPICGIGPGTAAQGFGGPPPASPTCSNGQGGVSFMTTFGGFAPLVGNPAAALHQDTANHSAALYNNAAVFTPNSAATPAGYTLKVY
jgi:hypothetical protein